MIYYSVGPAACLLRVAKIVAECRIASSFGNSRGPAIFRCRLRSLVGPSIASISPAVEPRHKLYSTDLPRGRSIHILQKLEYVHSVISRLENDADLDMVDVIVIKESCEFVLFRLPE